MIPKKQLLPIALNHNNKKKKHKKFQISLILIRKVVFFLREKQGEIERSKKCIWKVGGEVILAFKQDKRSK